MGRKTNAEKAAEAALISFLLILAVAAFIIYAIVKCFKQYPVFSCILLIVGIAGFVFYLIAKNKRAKQLKIEEEQQNKALFEKFKKESDALVAQIIKWSEKGLSVVENPNLSLPKEKIYFQEPFIWKNVGGNKEYRGSLYVTNDKIRYVESSSHSLKFEKIMRFEHSKNTFKLFPDNDKVVEFRPINGQNAYDEQLIVARFYAIWKIAECVNFNQFAPTLCEILGITSLKIEQQ